MAPVDFSFVDVVAFAVAVVAFLLLFAFEHCLDDDMGIVGTEYMQVILWVKFNSCGLPV